MQDSPAFLKTDVPDRLRTLLIHHRGAYLEEQVMAPWLASFSELVGVVVLEETRERRRRRIRREIDRVGPLRFLDVAAFRVYSAAVLARRDAEWERKAAEELRRRYGSRPEVETLETASPNSTDAERFIREREPDLVVARCRTLIDERVFSIPRLGTFVMHPGIVPEYRNSHGCFWALASGDLDRVGMTLLRIDAGVDTGPVYGYYTYPYDERRESHNVIQKRVVYENLEPLRDKLLEIAAGEAEPIDTSGHVSGAWGQPWLTRYLAWKRRARAR